MGKLFADVVRSAPALPLSGAKSVPIGPAPALPLSEANKIPIGAPLQNSILGRPSVFSRLQPQLGGRVLGVPASQSSKDHVGDRAPTPSFCQRCLSNNHHKAACRWPIRCRSCLNWGHTAVNYCSGKNSKVDMLLVTVKVGRLPLVGSTLPLPGHLHQSRPFSIRLLNWLNLWAARVKAPTVNAPQLTKPNTIPLNTAPDPLRLSLDPSPSFVHSVLPKRTPLKTPLLSYSTHRLATGRVPHRRRQWHINVPT